MSDEELKNYENYLKYKDEIEIDYDTLIDEITEELLGDNNEQENHQ